MFKERPDYHDTNREIAERAFIRQAELANGEIGVMLQYGKFPICLTNDEAITIATGFANTVEANRNGHH